LSVPGRQTMAPEVGGAGVDREAVHQMLRLLHLADARLGASHPDLGDAAAAHRERQFAALAAAVDIALAEKVEVVLVAGDLFASSVVSRRTVERAAAEIARLAAARIRTVILPGEHDPDDRASLYRAHDLAALAGTGPAEDLVTVLTSDRPVVHLTSLDLVVAGRPSAGARTPAVAPAEALASLGSEATAAAGMASEKAARGSTGRGRTAPVAAWRIGLIHAAPEAAGGDLPAAGIAATGLDYLALGGAPDQATGREGDVAWGVPGPPEQVVVDRPNPGGVLVVTLGMEGGRKTVAVEGRTTGRATHGDLVVDAASAGSQAALVEELRLAADADRVLDVRLVGAVTDDVVIEGSEMEDALREAYLRVRVHDTTEPVLTSGDLPPAKTVAGAFVRRVEGSIADLEASGDPDAADEAADLRRVLRLGRRLLAGEEVLA
jgi:hypothetical protein